MATVEEWLTGYIPERGRLALDIGANIGAWTTLLSGRFETVHSFDPNPQIIQTLRACVNQLENVKLYEMAVGSECGLSLFNLYPDPQHASAYLDVGPEHYMREGAIGKMTVGCMTLDSHQYQDQPVDFIKIDTEGGEASILAGAMETLQANHPRLIIEVHSLPKLDLCQKLLKKAGYTNVIHLPHPNPGVWAGHCWLIVNDPRV